MKSFKELHAFLNEGTMSEGSMDKRQWIIDQVEKTDKTHDEIKSNFIERFGKDKSSSEKARLSKFFDKTVHEIVD